jgi:hypothetical protein
MNVIVLRTFAILWTLIVTVGLLWPGDRGFPIPTASGWDKVWHFSLFFVSGLLWSMVVAQSGRRWLVLLFILGLGIALEGIQWYFPELHRSFEWLDMLANLVGGSLGYVVGHALSQKFCRPASGYTKPSS